MSYEEWKQGRDEWIRERAAIMEVNGYLSPCDALIAAEQLAKLHFPRYE